MNRFIQALVPLFLLTSLSNEVLAKQPNIVVILADDLGYSDLASYGSEINTPNIDQLASEGVRFSNHHAASSCAPTRAMLLTGVDSHRAGVANIVEVLPPEQKESPFYRGTLNYNVLTIATILKNADYHTYMSGKWHLGHKQPELRPFNRGFERTVMMADSGADNWEQRPYIPIYSKANWYADGEETTLPEDFYSSKFLVDKMIEFIEGNKEDDKPFFSYIPFQAVHIPVQAPKEFTEKYLGVYDQGWTELRKQRQAGVEKLGLMPKGIDMVDMHTNKDWDVLSDEEKRFQSKAMAVYAGMVDAMDYNIGRFIQYLKDTGEYDNTIFIFTSDNGAEASAPVELSKIFSAWLWYEGYSRDYDSLGEKGSFNYIGPSFASASAAPLSYYKFFAGEGGMRVPMIISGPAVPAEKKGSINHALTFVKDLAPTVLELAGVDQPGAAFKGREVEPMTGKSLVPLAAGTEKKVYGDNEYIAYEIGGNAALIKGDYKIFMNLAPRGDGQWHLYNIAKDPGETKDIRSIETERFTELKQDYQSYTKENGVLPMPEGYSQLKQGQANFIRDRLAGPMLTILGIIGVIALL